MCELVVKEMYMQSHCARWCRILLDTSTSRVRSIAMSMFICLSDHMKLVNTNNMQAVEQCSEQFNLVLPSRHIAE